MGIPVRNDATEVQQLNAISTPTHPRMQSVPNALHLPGSGGAGAAKSGAIGQLVLRDPRDLRMHAALEGLDLSQVMSEAQEEALRACRSVAEPILINTSGTILNGFGQWRLAVFEGRPEVDCIEYPINDENSLRLILNHHQPHRGWNAYVRICAALTMKPVLQERALDNMRAGGKCKGWATLPDVRRMDVRREIATIAGTGERNVSNVEKIRESAHRKLIEALGNGTLTINGAIKLCKFPRADQWEKFMCQSEDREIVKIVRKSVRGSGEPTIGPDVVTTLRGLIEHEATLPGSVAVRIGDHPRTIVVLGRDLLVGPLGQRRLI